MSHDWTCLNVDSTRRTFRSMPGISTATIRETMPFVFVALMHYFQPTASETIQAG